MYNLDRDIIRSDGYEVKGEGKGLGEYYELRERGSPLCHYIHLRFSSSKIYRMIKNMTIFFSLEGIHRLFPSSDVAQQCNFELSREETRQNAWRKSEWL